MPKADKALLILDAISKGGAQGSLTLDPRASLLTTLIYLCFMLSVPTTHIDLLLWYAIFPIISSPLLGISYTRIFLQSLIVLPIVLLIGIFNPLIDRSVVAYFNGVAITNGWLKFFGILIRGLLSMQALLILINSIGFTGIIRGAQRLGTPRFLVTQLHMVFRYIRVLIEEALSMKAARDSRSYGRKHPSIKTWGVLIGQLFLRSVDRAERIHAAMLARGFGGEIPFYGLNLSKWEWGSTAYLVVWSLVFLILRLFNFSLFFIRP